MRNGRKWNEDWMEDKKMNKKVLKENEFENIGEGEIEYVRKIS